MFPKDDGLVVLLQCCVVAIQCSSISNKNYCSVVSRVSRIALRQMNRDRSIVYLQISKEMVFVIYELEAATCGQKKTIGFERNRSVRVFSRESR